MTVKILIGDSLEILRTLESDSIHCVVTSPPYWGLRDYGVDGQMGLEGTPAEFIKNMVAVFDEVRRVLRPDGTCWVNMGDSYAAKSTGSLSFRRDRAEVSPTRAAIPDGIKVKDLMGMPWRLAFALQDSGWYLRQDIIWSKPNPMPESVQDRCTKSHEYIFLLTKSARYFYDAEAVKEDCVQEEARPSFRGGAYIGNSTFDNSTGGKSTDTGNVRRGVGFGHGTDAADRGRGRVKKVKVPGGWDQSEGAHGTIHRDGRAEAIYKEYVPSEKRNKRSVWTISTHSFPEAHFATFPPELAETCIKAGCPVGGIVLDPFFGAGTTGLVADRLQRDCIGIELNPAYAEIARKRIQSESPLFSEIEVAA
jgi:DNA modification methylase